MTKGPICREPRAPRRFGRAAGLAVSLLALLMPIGEAAAQTYQYPREQPVVRSPITQGGGKIGVGRVPVERQMPPTRGARPGRGGGGLGVGGAIGLGLGILGAAAAAQAAAGSDDEEPVVRRDPRRGRVIEVDEDAPPVRADRRGGDRPPPRDRPPRQAERPPSPSVRLPAAGETRFVAGEVLIETRADGRFEPAAGRLGLEILGRRPIRLTGTTLYRVKARDGRTTPQILMRLRQERSIAAAQPNWLYTLQQETAAPAPAAAASDTAPASGAVPTPVEAVVPPAPAEASAAATPVDAPAAPEPASPDPTNAPAPDAATPAPVETASTPATAAPAEAAAPAPAPTSPAAADAPIVATAATSAVAPAAPGLLPGQYFPGKLNLGAAHGRVKGAGVRVAVIDTGADESHPELVGAVEATFDSLDGVAPKTPGAHGTAMAGAVAARLRLEGAAPASKLLLARAFGPPAANGVAQGSTWNVVACLDWSVEKGARVVSMSFAGPSNDLLARALAAARGRGIVLVAASGNAGPQSPPLFPAADPGVIAVTASDPDDRVLPAAVRGNHVAVTAPGVDILVAAPQGGYDLTSGTSVAAAEVSGVVALVLEKRPDLKPDEARRILMETAIDLGPKGRDPIFGAGLVDAEAAVRAATRGR